MEQLGLHPSCSPAPWSGSLSTLLLRAGLGWTWREGFPLCLSLSLWVRLMHPVLWALCPSVRGWTQSSPPFTCRRWLMGLGRPRTGRRGWPCVLGSLFLFFPLWGVCGL